MLDGHLESGFDLPVVLEVAAVLAHIVGYHLNGSLTASSVPARPVLRVRTAEAHASSGSCHALGARPAPSVGAVAARLLMETAYRRVHCLPESEHLRDRQAEAAALSGSGNRAGIGGSSGYLSSWSA